MPSPLISSPALTEVVCTSGGTVRDIQSQLSHMMVALLLYAYSQGVYSSRRIARACEERLDFQAVFGHIKQARGFRQFLLRGIQKVSNERAMICTAHNLAKLVAWR